MAAARGHSQKAAKFKRPDGDGRRAIIVQTKINRRDAVGGVADDRSRVEKCLRTTVESVDKVDVARHSEHVLVVDGDPARPGNVSASPINGPQVFQLSSSGHDLAGSAADIQDCAGDDLCRPTVIHPPTRPFHALIDMNRPCATQLTATENQRTIEYGLPATARLPFEMFRLAALTMLLTTVLPAPWVIVRPENAALMTTSSTCSGSSSPTQLAAVVHSSSPAPPSQLMVANTSRGSKLSNWGRSRLG